MIIFERPALFLWIAFLMLLFGCVMPFLMVLEIVPSTLWLNFLSFAMSTAGLFLGIIATSAYRRKQRNKKDE